MATYTVYLFTTLDGFGTGRVAFWGKEGPELVERHARIFFAGEDETLVFGANTYRMMEHFAAERRGDPNFESLSARRKIVISRTLKEPLTWANATLIAAAALDMEPRSTDAIRAPVRS